MLKSPAPPDPVAFEFGPFRLDLAENRLLRTGEPVPLTPKVFDLLVALVRREGRLAAKNELMEEIWPDTFVDEANLTQNVFTLRKALGDGAEGATYVETVPRRGYRFAAPVRAVVASAPLQDPGVAPAPPAAVVEPAGARTLNRTFAVGVATVLVVAASMGLWWSRRGTSTPRPFEPVSFAKITATGDVVDAAMSPDGRFVAFVRSDGRTWSLWLYQVATSNALQIGPEEPSPIDKLTFSADGERLYFVRTGADGASALHVIATFGGPVRRLIDGTVSPVAVSPDGSRIAFVTWLADRGERHLFVAKADGSEPRSVLVRRSPFVIVYQGPAWSPDGRHLSVVVNEGFGGRTPELIDVEVESGSARTITRSLPWNAGKPVWQADGRGLIVAAGQLWHVSYPDGAARPLTREASSYGNLSMARDGRTLAALQLTETSAIWMADAGDFDRARLVLREAGFNHGLAWLPDGRLLFESSAGGDTDVSVTTLDGRSVSRLSLGPAIDNFPSTAADDVLVYATTREGGSTIHRRSLDGSGDRRISDDGTHYGPERSPDGRWVAFHRADPRLSWTIWRTPIEGGTPEQLTTQSSTFPVYSPDGRFLACNYLEDNGWSVAVLPAAGGAPTMRLPAAGGPTRRLAWSPDGTAIYFAATDDALWRIRVDGGAPERLAQFEGERITALRWSPDGTRLAYVRNVRRNDVVLVRSP